MSEYIKCPRCGESQAADGCRDLDCPAGYLQEEHDRDQAKQVARKRDRRFADDPNFKQLFQTDERRKSERRA